MRTTRTPSLPVSCAVALLLLAALPARAAFARPLQQADDPNPPDQVIRLIFIHHSTGENWLRDDYGGLGAALAENNYFVSDTNYGWGPDSIGDRTDIPDWAEWFASVQTPVFMQALFNESEQLAGYGRPLADPGGENQIILFKSCFPNSALEGSPGDPPDPDGWLTVGHAKYVYNQILGYFASRPDKLFIVITAPPLSDGTYAENARAFNDWLLNDWLNENSYTQPNVAVFDLYNLLTARDAHHWYQDGAIEHLSTSRNTLHYPSGDDHPSAAGSRKATEEFLPLLNIFYHRWAGTAPAQLEAGTDLPTASELPSSGGAGPDAAGLIADFDSLTPSLAAYWDEAVPSEITCARSTESAYQGQASLQIDFAIDEASWSTCVLAFDTPQDWSAGAGLSFALQAEREGLPYQILIYAGSTESPETYLDDATTPQDSQDGWATVEIPWNEFHRVDWESGAGTDFSQPGQILSIGFGFPSQESSRLTGTVWVDEIHLMGLESQPSPSDEVSPASGRGVPCLGSLLLPILLALSAWAFRRH